MDEVKDKRTSCDPLDRYRETVWMPLTQEEEDRNKLKSDLTQQNNRWVITVLEVISQIHL